MPVLTSTTSLSRVIDEHLDWFVAWHKLAFIVTINRQDLVQQTPPPRSFFDWFQAHAQQLPQDQPAIDRLAVLHDQMHTMARLVLMRTPDGAPLSQPDYEAVTARYHAFMSGIRRLECAFAVAASGLDLLTGLRSRVGLAEDLLREQNRFERTGKPYCLAIADLDYFKSINDTHGHDVGDRVLAATADIISRQIRSFDDAYRLGGEEFLICLKEIDLADAYQVLDRLRERLATTPVSVPGQQPIPVTASFGLIESMRDQRVEDMLHRADQALYRAKKSGRNRIVVAEN